MRGHTLVWHNSVPDWVLQGSFTDAELRAILKQHIETMVGRYAGRVAAWDVVNEALDADGALRPSIWLERLGPGYIADAFRWARAADPTAKLYYREKPAYARVHETLANRDFEGIAKVMHSLRCLEVPNANNGAALRQWGWDTVNQQFAFRRVAPRTYTIVSERSGRCMAVSGASTANGAAIVQTGCADRAEQRFELRAIARPDSDQYFQVVAVHSGRCLHVDASALHNGAPVTQRTCVAQDHQIWRLEGASGHL